MSEETERPWRSMRVVLDLSVMRDGTDGQEPNDLADQLLDALAALGDDELPPWVMSIDGVDVEDEAS